MFEWEQFLDVAVCLQELGDSNRGLSEAAYRCAISRAYYGAYHSALSLAQNLGYVISPPKRGGMSEHRKLQVWYQNECANKSLGKRISGKLRRLHNWRKNADYKDIDATTMDFKACCDSAINESISLIQQIHEYHNRY